MSAGEVVDDRELGDLRECLGCPNPLPPGSAKQRRYCSPPCRQRAKDRNKNRGTTGKRRNASRGPLPVFASKVGWSLRADVERLERIFADDRFTEHKQQVAAHLRGHLEYAAEVCQDLLSRLDRPTGE